MINLCVSHSHTLLQLHVIIIQNQACTLYAYLSHFLHWKEIIMGRWKFPASYVCGMYWLQNRGKCSSCVPIRHKRMPEDHSWREVMPTQWTYYLTENDKELESLHVLRFHWLWHNKSWVWSSTANGCTTSLTQNPASFIMQFVVWIIPSTDNGAIMVLINDQVPGWVAKETFCCADITTQ